MEARIVGVASPARRFAHGQALVRQGQVPDCLFLVRAGVVRLAAALPTGHEVVVGMLGPGDVFGECALLGDPSPVEARAASLVQVEAVPLTALSGGAGTQPRHRHRAPAIAGLPAAPNHGRAGRGAGTGRTHAPVPNAVRVGRSARRTRRTRRAAGPSDHPRGPGADDRRIPRDGEPYPGHAFGSQAHPNRGPSLRHPRRRRPGQGNGSGDEDDGLTGPGPP